ncbi:MAG: DsbA family protein [Candidatus Sedimenticola endophacoides]
MGILYYIHDPMCSWCWAFRPAWERIVHGLPPGIEPRLLLGGLASDCDQPMPEALRRKLRGVWRTTQRQVPGTPFNFAFWERCTPRRSTYPACRAVIAARRQSPRSEEAMILAIQRAYYLQARNPSDAQTLCDLAAALGLDPARLASDLASPGVNAALRGEIEQGARLGVRTFPSLVLVDGARTRHLPHDYLDPDLVLALL